MEVDSMICENCKKEFFEDYRKDKKYKKKVLPRFCSKECAHIHSKEVNLKIARALQKNPRRFCKCGRKISFSNKRGMCRWCFSKSRTLNRSKESFFKEGKNWQAARSSIRRHAYKVYFEVYKKPYKCAKCDYTFYVEVAHKKSVSEFPMDATLEEINSIDNLIGLCPNHHWEFDHKITNS
jgi:HNH endonuclease